MGEKQTRFVKSSDSEIEKLVAKLMLFRKVQKSQQNMQSTFLKVKKVKSSLSDCESLFRMTVCQVLVQSQ